MKTLPTHTALSILAQIQNGDPNAVFLCKQNTHPLLLFGMSQTPVVQYLIHLHRNGKEVLLRSQDHNSFALILDRRSPKLPLRLVLYDGVDPHPIIEYDGENNDLSGQVFIYAHAAQSEDEAIIHAVFSTSGNTSFIIDADPELMQHLRLASEMLEGRTQNEPL